MALNLHSPNLCLQGRCEGVAHCCILPGHASLTWVGLGDCMDLEALKSLIPRFLKVTAGKKEDELLPARRLAMFSSGMDGFPTGPREEGPHSI